MMTAVEWLINEMPVIDWQDPYWKIKLEKAKEMESEQKKQLVIFFYIDLKMKNNKLPYGMKYLNKLSKLEEEAEQYYNKTLKQEKQ